MQKIILAMSLAFSFAGNAAGVGPFDNVSKQKPACFTRSYTDKHMKAHPLQTVKKMDVKLEKGDDINLIEIKVLRTNNKRYKTALACSDAGECFIDCDGGSAKLKMAGNALQLINNGFIMEGGCDEPEVEIIFLESKPGGDDVFLLSPAQCK